MSKISIIIEVKGFSGPRLLAEGPLGLKKDRSKNLFLCVNYDFYTGGGAIIHRSEFLQEANDINIVLLNCIPALFMSYIFRNLLIPR